MIWESPFGEPTVPEAPEPDDLGVPLPEPEPLKGVGPKSPPWLMSAAATDFPGSASQPATATSRPKR